MFQSAVRILGFRKLAGSFGQLAGSFGFQSAVRILGFRKRGYDGYEAFSVDSVSIRRADSWLPKAKGE